MPGVRGDCAAPVTSCYSFSVAAILSGPEMAFITRASVKTSLPHHFLVAPVAETGEEACPFTRFDPWHSF